jgi:hypothetical protein
MRDNDVIFPLSKMERKGKKEKKTNTSAPVRYDKGIEKGEMRNVDHPHHLIILPACIMGWPLPSIPNVRWRGRRHEGIWIDRRLPGVMDYAGLEIQEANLTAVAIIFVPKRREFQFQQVWYG